MENRICELLRLLENEYPERQPLLTFENPYQLTVAVALSAQTTDAAVNAVTPEIFSRWPKPSRLAQADPAELEEIIHSLGFFRQKSRNLIACARRLTEEFGGKIPSGINDLVSLPGIGRKSANVIRAHIWNLPGIIVDTHFGRVCRRLGLTVAQNPETVEKEMAAKIPADKHIAFSMTVNLHGRRCCTARKPNCGGCVLGDLCMKTNV